MEKGIIIANPEDFEKKKQELIGAGPNNLHIVTDFDKTLAKAFVKGQKAHTMVAQLREGNYISKEYVDQAFALYEYYHPFEVSHDIPQEEKNSKMVEWWTKHLELFIKHGLRKKVIKHVIKDNKLVLRDGTLELFKLLKKAEIPMIIFSGSIGDIIEEYLKFKKILNKDVHIIANFLEFDENEKAIGYKSKIIHTFNKNEGQVKTGPFYPEIKKRKNVILLGDNLGDLGMAEGLEHNSIIKIGFLNENVENLLDKFKEQFDVIILDDGPMDFVNRLVEKII